MLNIKAKNALIWESPPQGIPKLALRLALNAQTKNGVFYEKNAMFSECRTYRYALWTVWE
jgi:hypothetical protein